MTANSPKREKEEMFLITFNTRAFAIVAVVLASTLSGCASIVNGTSQVVSVEAHDNKQKVVGARCQMTNSKGVYFVTTPGTVTVHRAYGDMSVKCEKADFPTGTANVKSTTKPMAFGNILFGGVIGVAVDTGSGAAYDYPSLISVKMGEDVSMPTAVSEKYAEAITERWDGVMACEARADTGQNSGAYQVKFTMEVRGNSVNVHRKTAEVLETLSGQVTDNILELRGIGYRIKDPSRNWQLRIKGDLQSGATAYSGKGSMLFNGKVIRACELTMTRSSIPAS